MMKRKLLIMLIISLLSLGVANMAYAHGVKITHQANMAFDISAAFDTGEQLEGAQVTIFAPDNPSKPWSTGVCDKNGHFTFTPDFSKPGNWAVQVRKGGHGGLIHISVGEDMAASGSTGYTALQMVLMAGCVVWGLVGTGLFFSRRKS